MPIIFITGHGDIPMSVQAMKAGAIEFLTKPFGDNALLSAIRNASNAARPHLVMRWRYGRYGTVTRRSRLAKGKSWPW
jgi:FixJ family two-component response regulator